MFDQNVQIRFRDADPAGIMFFARAFDLAHDAYEDFLDQLGLGFKECFLNPELAIPLVRAESDYKKPMLAGQSYSIQVRTAHIGNSSFSLSYEFTKDETIHAILQTHHVCINPKQQSKVSIPEALRAGLTKHLKN